MKKSGHTDVASSRRMCMTIIEDAEDILRSLPRDMEQELPTWWTNKLAVTSAYLNAARDYIMYSQDPMEEERDESENDENDSEVSENVSEEIMEAVEDFIHDVDDMLPPSAKMVRSEDC
jgi:hypothetical protein